jgi:hypothetical protein
MTYQPAVYRQQGGDELVVASSGLITVESGGKIDLESGSTMTIAGPVTLTGAITCGTGGYLANAVQTAATSATTILPYGLTLVTGTSDIPTFLMSNPIVGVPKWLLWTGTSGDGSTSIGAIIAAATTSVTFDTSGQHKLTLESSGLRGVSLIGVTTARWGVVGTKYQADAGLST